MSDWYLAVAIDRKLNEFHLKVFAVKMFLSWLKSFGKEKIDSFHAVIVRFVSRGIEV